MAQVSQPQPKGLELWLLKIIGPGLDILAKR